MSSPLDRIEAGARARLGRKGGATLEAHDLLALVAVARAAEHVLAHGKLGKQSERRLREALSRLGKDTAA